MFADYRVPQALAYLGVLKYSSDVFKKLQEHTLLENGSELEVQLRAFSIKACEVSLKTYFFDGMNFCKYFCHFSFLSHLIDMVLISN